MKQDICGFEDPTTGAEEYDKLFGKGEPTDVSSMKSSSSLPRVHHGFSDCMTSDVWLPEECEDVCWRPHCSGDCGKQNLY